MGVRQSNILQTGDEQEGRTKKRERNKNALGDSGQIVSGLAFWRNVIIRERLEEEKEMIITQTP